MSEFLFGPTPHQEAIDFLQSKPIVSKEVFDKLLPELKARAFVISGVEDANVVGAIRRRLSDLPAGVPWDKIKKDIADDLHPFLANPEDPESRIAAERRAELLLRTHGFQAYQAAAYEVGERQADVFPYLQYKSMGDGKVRPAHASLDNIVLPRDHEFWSSHTPPWDWGCRCQAIPISEDDRADLVEADKGKPLDSQNVLGEYAQADLTATRRLVRNGVSHNVSSPAELGKPNAYQSHVGDLRLSLDELKGRYDAQTWAEFQTWAQGQAIQEGVSVWDWLQGKALASSGTNPQPTPPTAQQSAKPAKKGKAPKKGKPVAIPLRQSPVSNALDVIIKGPQKKQVINAINQIDIAHDDGTLPKIRVDGKTGKNALGEFDPTNHRIGIRASGTWPGLTMCHEAGHALDRHAMGVVGKWASASAPEFAEWRAAMDVSHAIATISSFPPSPTRNYFLSKHEQWARSYAQYIAVKTQDPQLLADLDRVRTSGAGWRQWADDDFKPIAEAIDKVFKGYNWI